MWKFLRADHVSRAAVGVDEAAVVALAIAQVVAVQAAVSVDRTAEAVVSDRTTDPHAALTADLAEVASEAEIDHSAAARAVGPAAMVVVPDGTVEASEPAVVVEDSATVQGRHTTADSKLTSKI